MFFLCKLTVDPRPRYTAALIALFGWLFLFCAYYAIMFLVFAVSMYGGALILHRAATLAWSRRVLQTFPSPWVIATVVAAAVPCLWLAVHSAPSRQTSATTRRTCSSPTPRGITSFFDVPEGSLLLKTQHFDWGAHEARLFYGVHGVHAARLPGVDASGERGAEGDREAARVRRAARVRARARAVRAPCARRRIHPAAAGAALRRIFFPGFGALRSVGRFGVFAVVMIAPLTELAARRLLDRVEPRHSHALYATLFVLVAVEQTTVQKAKPIDLDARRPFYEQR